MLNKLHYTIPEVATEWSTLTGRRITEDDILRIASDTGLPWVLMAQGVKLSFDELMQHPSLSLHAYIRKTVEINDGNDMPNTSFSGRIFIDCDQVALIINQGFVILDIGHDIDNMRVLRFAKPLKLQLDDLVITAANKTKFEALFSGVVKK